jgi:hypothetical protein
MTKTTFITQHQNGQTVRVTRLREKGIVVSIVAKKGKTLLVKNGFVCATPLPMAVARKRLYVQMPPLGEQNNTGLPIRLDSSIEQATLFPDPLSIIPLLIELLLINTDNCSHIEIGNQQHAQRVELPVPTPHQRASLAAMITAEKTGRAVSIHVKPLAKAA